MNTIAYLVYGSRPEYQLELTYSVLSAAHHIGPANSDYTFLLITEEGKRRDDLPVDHLFFSRDEWEAWTRNDAYNHEAKPNALALALKKRGGKLALIDPDTYFVAHPEKLFNRIGPGKSVMQAMEGRIGTQEIWQPLLSRVTGSVGGYQITGSAKMNNSGVVGLHEADVGLLEEAIALARELYKIEPVFSIEQFAVTAVLDRHTELTVCPDVVYHYWGVERPFMHAQIAALFPEFTRDRFDRMVVSPPRIGYPKKKLSDQVRARIKAIQRRESSAYRFAYLAYLSALSSARQDALNASVWAGIALLFVRKHAFPRLLVRSDFFALYRPEECAWLSPEVRRDWLAYWDERGNA